jgi:ATP-dependent helicase Lhr and Lhr-like helicase
MKSVQRHDSRGRGAAAEWFERRGWTPQAFQQEVWSHFLDGRNGLLHSDTGSGKTLAAWFGPLIEYLDEEPETGGETPPQVLWITPLRALAYDTELSLRAPVEDLGLPWRVERRTGDVSASVKARQKERLPAALITTPESLSLLLSYPHTYRQLASVRAVIVDEWHEFMGTKRGVQVELCLARLRRFCPKARFWALSATMSNLEEAGRALAGADAGPVTIVRGPGERAVVIETLVPEEVERFPWAGHLGLKMLPAVLSELEEAASALIFTNTRGLTEQWYRAILEARPEWAGRIALHHGSLNRATRQWVEDSLAAGAMKCVVCTSSLDLGVDFTPVDRVFQIGSPKGVARLLQRAGRSGHQPGRTSRVYCVPTHAIEMLEFAAVRRAARRGHIEPREPVVKPLDLLVQHLVTVALGTGFDADELFQEITSTYAYRNLLRSEFDWAIRFAESGGESLRAYEEYQRITPFRGTYVGTTDDVARRHRMSIGTIVSEANVTIKYLKGKRLGTVEESFVARLSKGDQFFFAGKTLEFIRMRDMVAYVKRAATAEGPVPKWTGPRMPLSAELSASLRTLIDAIERGEAEEEEAEALERLLALQKRWSTLPRSDQLLIERAESREGHHIFLFPFEGRLVHEGLAALFALRMSRLRPTTFSMAYNDYAIELLSEEEAPLAAAIDAGLFDTAGLIQDIEAGLNEVEMMRRHFREIARVAGLVFQGYPGRGKTQRQLQVSSGLLFDVFRRHDPKNLLLRQAREEVLSRQLEATRLTVALERLQRADLLIVDVPRFTPFAFPVVVDRLRERLSSEKLADRVRRMQVSLEKEAG